MVRRIASVLILSCAPLAAFAGDPLSYSFIEGQYLNTQYTPELNGTKGAKDKYEGWRAAANVSLYKGLYFTGEADKRRATDYRFGMQSVGLGWHTNDSLTKAMQVFGDVTYERTIFNFVNASGFDDADEGYGVRAGVRVPFESFEFSASYRYMNYGETNNVKVTGGKYGAGAAMQLTPFFALTADYRQVDITDKGTGVDAKASFAEWLVGFRSYFATDIDRYRRRGGIFSSGE